ncbi:Predicted amino acid dehydrogenase [Desulfonispora thiosulfatigenes DSM 11270]|uniref:Predicted amino acid dehydrogenase n=1 Tax=Desulfonispora thiosulfatigenes DSM 11270 TaxID=656914 RepID=A0A1W1UUC8_DESTI|nr:hypothetical protein [Desulfonispora thiosulfatigenes]SMB84599.1 Predicted amino acid dehydrogenase [Desulfonispora thiosulfatigenes DSM 11270]
MRRFAFIMHPLETEDYFRKFPLLKRVPNKIIEKTIRFAPPMKVSEITNLRSKYEAVEGFIIACPLTTKQILNLPKQIILKKLNEAISLSIKLGVEVIGIGGELSVIAEKFQDEILKDSSIPITIGDNYKIAIIIEETLKAIEGKKGDIQNAHIAILGATSSKGTVITRILAPKCKYLTIASETNEDLTKLTRRIMYEHGIAIKISRDIKDILKNNDIVILATNLDKKIINLEDIKTGSVFSELVKDKDLVREIKAKRKDVLTIEEGLIKVPENTEINFNFSLPKELVYASMAETMILALEGKYDEFILGNNLTLESILEINRLSRKHGFQLQQLLDII